jgi:hypothetical protein
MNLDMEKNVNFKIIYTILLKNTLDFIVTKCALICQVYSLDFESIHWF